METNNQLIRFSWASIIAILLFFFNTMPILNGLSVALFCLPLWIYLGNQWSLFNKKNIGYALLVFAIFGCIHFYNGVYVKYYLISTVVLMATLFFTVVFYFAVLHYSNQIDQIFKQIVILNFVLTILCLPFLFSPSLKDFVWYTITISANIAPISRLKMFTAEASHYSYVLAPLFIYCYSRFFFFKIKHPWLTLLMITIPLLLSFSLGVWSCLFFSGVMIALVYYNQIFYNRQRKMMLWISVLFIISFGVLLFFLVPNNPLYVRVMNVIHRKDTSANGRTFDSFFLAHQIISTKSVWWGIGPGQFKLFGRVLTIQYYNYANMPSVVRIPNACADTIVCYGYVGLLIRLGIQIALFFKTSISQNPFRLWLFLFLFIYQFTGSYINNTTEYLLWALVFAPIFTDFIVKKTKSIIG